MKSIITTVCLLAIGMAGLTQATYKLQIVHKLHGEDFSMQQESFNNMGHAMEFVRLEYYLSEFSIIHDGGQETVIEDLWALVDASGATVINLGSVSGITDIESVGFHVGVDPDHNHLDPSSWPPSHPLAHQNPSMHWGWTAGYRFVALRGYSGEGLDQEFDIHALGDGNYFKTTVDVDSVVNGGDIVITIFANYAGTLEDLDMTNGLVLHSEIGEAQGVLENFRDHVFMGQAPADTTLENNEDTGTVSSVQVIHSVAPVSAYPNPASNGTIQLQSAASQVLEMEIIDLQGRVVQRTRVPSGASTISGLNEGIYLLRYSDASKHQTWTERVLIL